MSSPYSGLILYYSYGKVYNKFMENQPTKPPKEIIKNITGIFSFLLCALQFLSLIYTPGLLLAYGMSCDGGCKNLNGNIAWIIFIIFVIIYVISPFINLKFYRQRKYGIALVAFLLPVIFLVIISSINFITHHIFNIMIFPILLF